MKDSIFGMKAVLIALLASPAVCGPVVELKEKIRREVAPRNTACGAPSLTTPTSTSTSISSTSTSPILVYSTPTSTSITSSTWIYSSSSVPTYTSTSTTSSTWIYSSSSVPNSATTTAISTSTSTSTSPTLVYSTLTSTSKTSSTSIYSTSTAPTSTTCTTSLSTSSTFSTSKIYATSTSSKKSSTSTSSKATTTTSAAGGSPTQCSAANNYGYRYQENTFSFESLIILPEIVEIVSQRGDCCKLCYSTENCYGFEESGSALFPELLVCQLEIVQPKTGVNVSSECPKGQAELNLGFTPVPYIPGVFSGCGQGPCGIFPSGHL